MSLKQNKKFKYKKRITCSDDILQLRDKIFEDAELLSFPAPHPTVMAATSSDIYRLSLEIMDNPSTNIQTFRDRDSSRITIEVTGRLTDGNIKTELQDYANANSEVAEKLRIAEQAFGHLKLTFNGSQDVTIEMEKYLSNT